MNLQKVAFTALALIIGAASSLAVETESTSATDKSQRKSKCTSTPPVVHSAVGDTSAGVDGSLKLVNIGKKQQYSAAMKSSYDTDINSPKSVSFSPDGKRFYVNSLEGCRTVVYDAATLEKIDVINHSFPSGRGELWAKPSGYYKFTHYPEGESRAFHGKPVEMSWSHSGRYLWVPYYRRTFDLNAQDPSAVAVIDVRTNKIIRMFETGPLPKMVATSPNGKYMAVTHWGDNTIGLIDISSGNPAEWHHLPPVVVGSQLKLNYSLSTPVNRDSGSGFLLRGTVFTPDSKYLLVSGMAGQLAVIDPSTSKCIGRVPSVQSVRHLAISDGYVYGTQNSAGTAIKFSLDSLLAGVDRAIASGSSSIQLPGGIKTVKVGGGARTLDVSPDGKYLFVACNSGNAVYVVEAESMKVVDHIRCDSYPVGLALSTDGRRLVVTSQGRKGGGGNAVNIFDVIRPDLPESDTTVVDTTATIVPAATGNGDAPSAPQTQQDKPADYTLLIFGAIAVLAAASGITFAMRRRKS
ncbi:MAG: hypothetical protein NC111_01460 [Bacteroides sp.]|nr:hypothetical protein [Bacteroides sp.]MCM1413601.1 hypothetical protein [Bacteroides sp.]MCM1471182.1 hypothetical protein [Bacteroides sp.]